MKTLSCNLFEITDLFKGADPSVLIPELSKNEQVLLMIAAELKEKEQADIRVSALVEHTGWPAPAVSRTLKSLEEKELILRKTDTKNRRNTFVYVTDKGLTMSQRISGIMDRYMKIITDEIGEEEFLHFRETVLQIIQTVKKHLEEERGNTPS